MDKYEEPEEELDPHRAEAAAEVATPPAADGLTPAV
jgi:hypothetical protein